MAFYSNAIAVAPPTEQIREKLADESTLRRLSQAEGEHPGIRQRIWGLDARTDPTVTFQEYRFWAKIEREMEEVEYKRFQASNPNKGFIGGIKSYFTSNVYEDAKKHESPGMIQDNPSQSSGVEKEPELLDADGKVQGIAPSNLTEYDADWRVAARALRTASWGSIFFLVTTDILGWSGTPYTFSSVGYGLGVGIFIIFALAAMASGLMIWRTYLALDSSRFPMLSFGDPFLRLFGPKMRHFVNVLQAFQQFCSVAVIILGNAQIIAQVNGEKLCFIVCLLITVWIGMASGVIRALKHLGWVCNLAVWMNVTSFIIICVAAAKYPVNYSFAIGYTNLRNLPAYQKLWHQINDLKITPPNSAFPAPKTFVGVPPLPYQNAGTTVFAAEFGGIDTMVYAFSGALLFVAFLSEMRRPMDFWKGMILAQVFIMVVYIFFGAFVYSYYGQYSYSLINQIINPKNLLTAGNILSLITSYLAIFLYFNVGFKTVYLEVGTELLKFPPYGSQRGKIYWYTLGPVYWILAFVFAASVPYFFAFVNFIGGLFSLNFTYTFSGIMYAAYKIQEGATLPGEGFDPATGISTQHDRGLKRWVRGFKKTWMLTLPTILFLLGGLASSGMGTWSAILGFESSAAGSPPQTSWKC